ncbi:alkaline phosphatase D family protein [Spongiimicrobium salis]|uniref:alkaline phosphatase D family protein n=1 Tax=Spongiimicrobium salis TaxID=1667022 RepID=UPI00374D7DFE
MKKYSLYLCFVLLLCTCKSHLTPLPEDDTTAFTIAFGSCNRQELENLLWDDILNEKPDLWIWGGDNIYADTSNRDSLRSMYTEQNNIQGYRKLKNTVPVIGTWDDHDYGKNDGGVEFLAKKESQQEFLNFMGVPQDSPRRQREGVYASHEYAINEQWIKVIVLDTRYFRTALSPDTETKKRNKPNPYGEGTVLGEQQWKWLESELMDSKADFNILVSSIQFLSNEHGFEGWGNFPHEIDRLKALLVSSRVKGALLLSGDRHISEFSKTNVQGMSYPLIDFTSSGLTHAYSGFTEEYNPFRVGEVVHEESYGVLEFNMKRKKIRLKMMGDQGKVLGVLEQSY